MARDMGATYKHVFTDRTTHLVCSAAKGSKYEAAVHSPLWGHVKLVTPEYVRLCHDNVMRLDETTHLTPTLAGIRVSISGFGTVGRETLRELVVSAGGTYSPSLNEGTTDVLIACQPRGAKYSAAVAWKIPCVTRQWLHDSLASGRNLKARDYALKQNASGYQFKWDESDILQGSRNAYDSEVFDNVIAFICERGVLDPSKSSFDVILSRGQGTRLPAVASVTHIVISSGVNPTDQEIQLYARHRQGPHIIQAAWMTESAKFHEKQAELDFAFSNY